MTLVANETTYDIKDFNFFLMTPQRSIEERRLEKCLRKFHEYIPLFNISPSIINGHHSLAIRMHIYVEKIASWGPTRDKYREVRAIIPVSVFDAATDEDISQWIYDAIVRTRKNEKIREFTAEMVVKGYWLRAKRKTTLSGLIALTTIRNVFHMKGRKK